MSFPAPMPQIDEKRAVSGAAEPASGVRPRLIVLAPSHFCERARWALDHAAMPYREERWAPGPHLILARRLGLAGTITPILDRRDGTIIQGSDAILDLTGLRGGDREIEHHFVNRIAPLVRQYRYAALLNDPRSGIREVLLDGVPPAQALAGRLVWPGVRRLMIRSMNTRADLLPALADQIEAELAWFAIILAERGEHLVGSDFGRADLTAASLLAPLAQPPEHPLCAVLERLTLPSALTEALSRWNRRPALVWTNAVYAAHRNARASSLARA